MKINCVALYLWEADDGSLQRQSLEGENIPTSAVGPANSPSMAERQSHSSLNVREKTRAICITRLSLSLQLFYGLGFQTQPGYPKLLNATKIKGHRFPHGMPGLLSASVPAKIIIKPATKGLPVTSSSSEGHLAFK